MRLICDECGGTGKVLDENRHMDFCPKCFGLGYIEGEPDQDDEAKRRGRRFYTFASMAVVILGLYYIGLYLAVRFFGFTLLVTMVLFVGGHIILFGGLLVYVLMRILRNNGNADIQRKN